MNKLWLLLFVSMPAIAQNTIVFTAETTTAVGQTTPILTHQTIPPAYSCMASGDWEGEKGFAGTETLSEITDSATYGLTCFWSNDSVTLSWTAPTKNTDGTALTDLDGYIVYYGTNSGNYPNTETIDTASVTSYLVENLSAGSWFFVITAVNTTGIESEFSGEATKIVTGEENESESVSITVNAQPNPATGLIAE